MQISACAQCAYQKGADEKVKKYKENRCQKEYQHSNGNYLGLNSLLDSSSNCIESFRICMQINYSSILPSQVSSTRMQSSIVSLFQLRSQFSACAPRWEHFFLKKCFYCTKDYLRQLLGQLILLQLCTHVPITF